MEPITPARARRHTVLALGATSLLMAGFGAGLLTGRITDDGVDVNADRCPTSSIFNSRSQERRVEDCLIAVHARTIVRSSGAKVGDVSVDHVDSTSFHGPDSVVHVHVQVTGAPRSFSPELVRSLIARVAGTEPKFIELVDESANPLFHGEATP